MKTKVVVVIPNWNGAVYIADCLTSLQMQTLQPHIIVVENGSTDESVKIIKSKFKSVELLEFADNAGFAGGVNRGIKKALKDKFDYVALFNNDAVADKNWLKQLVLALETQKSAGIVTGKLMRTDKKHLDSTGDFYSIWGMPFPRGRNQKDKGQYDEAEHVFAASGGASLYRSTMLKEIGLFDEDFFAYFEDVDISLRAQLAGWKVWYEPKAVAYHHVSATSDKLGSFTRYHSIKNIILLRQKNLPLWLRIKYSPLFFMQLARMKLGAIRDSETKVYLRGFFATIKLHSSTKKKRLDIKKTRKLSTHQVDELLYHNRPPKIPTL